jgi:hypothetical protein
MIQFPSGLTAAVCWKVSPASGKGAFASLTVLSPLAVRSVSVAATNATELTSF